MRGDPYCPLCHGKGEYVTEGDLHKSPGLIPCPNRSPTMPPAKVDTTKDATKTKAKAAPRKTPSLGVRYKLSKFLEESLEPISEGIVRYKDSLNDEKVAEQFGISIVSVRTTRQEIFGNVRVSRGEQMTIAKLEGKLRALYNQLGIAWED